VKVEIWSDFICPFCYMGKRKFELALEQFPNKTDIQIEYVSYQLDPNAMEQSNKTIYEMLMEKYGRSFEEVKSMTGQITMQAKEVGLDFRFDKMKHVNTLNAHRLVKLAKKYGKDKELVDLIFKSYFSEGKQIDNKQELNVLAVEIGLEEEEVDETLAMNCFLKAVKSDLETAKEIGIQGVPFFVFNERYAISGAQPVDVFLNVLEEVWKENELEKTKIENKNTCTTNYCTGKDCDS